MTNKQFTLGRLITALKDVLNEDTKDLEVVFDFSDTFPTVFSSWRGDYERLALGYHNDWNGKRKPMTLETFLRDCENTVGNEFQGYKGGMFEMTLETLIYVSEIWVFEPHWNHWC